MRICKLIFFNPSFNTLTDFNLQSKDVMEHILNKKTSEFFKYNNRYVFI